MNKLRILVISPSFELHGGVVEFNKMLLKYSSSTLIFFKTKSGVKNSKLAKISWLLLDYLRFIFILLTKSVDLVHINPSLAINSIKRDGYFLRISKFFKKKVYVHWHGWNPDNEYLLKGNHLFFLRKTFFKADHLNVLSEYIALKFKEIGFLNKITLGSTFVDNELLSLEHSVTKNANRIQVLFLATVSKNKGIYLALDAFKIVQKEYPSIELTVAGDGPELTNAKDYIINEQIEGVRFVGHVNGYQKAKLFSESHIYLFPSLYEGMPTSVLEAMAFGLVLITSNAGAIPDFFIQEKMGRMVSTRDINDYVLAIKQFVDSPEYRIIIKDFNMNFASQSFLASDVIAKIDEDYLILCNQ